MHTADAGHNHGLHVVIPTPASEPASRVPPTNATDAPVALDTPGTPGHSHTNGRFVLPTSSRAPESAHALDTPGHNHGLFRWPPVGTDAATPASPRVSARVARRSSLFSVSDDAEAASGAGQESAHVLSAQSEGELQSHTHFRELPPTAETEEPASAEVHGSFDVDGNGNGGNNRAVEGGN